MPARHRNLVDEIVPKLIGDLPELRSIEIAQIGWNIDLIEQWGF
jgi:hypothetical protein